MSDHGTIIHPTTMAPTDPELFFEDRQKFWGGFTNALLALIIFVIVLLVGMAVFLL